MKNLNRAACLLCVCLLLTVILLAACGHSTQPFTDNGDGTVRLYLAQFVITYDSANQQTYVPAVAKAFASRVKQMYGAVEISEDDTVNQYEILFGTCDRQAFKTVADKQLLLRDYYIGYADNKLSVGASSIYGYERAIGFLLSGFDEDGITIPAAGLHDVYAYGTDSYAQIRKNYENPNFVQARMVSISHRGDTTTDDYPENSIPAYRSCVDNGVDVIETDLKKTADAVWVICHDQTIDRTTTGSGTISQMTADQLQPYFLMSRNGGAKAAITDSKIPTMVEAIDLCRGNVLLMLDHLDPAMFQEVYDIFEEKDAVEIAIFKSANWTAADLTDWFCRLLEDGRKLPLFSPLIYRTDSNRFVMDAQAFAGLTTMVETGRDHAPGCLRDVADCNMRVMCLTALDPASENLLCYSELADMGYTAIMTDTPLLLKEFIHSGK